MPRFLRSFYGLVSIATLLFPQTRALRLFFAVLIFLSLAVAVPARIIINEIHFNPDVKTEPAEFIELYNTGATPVNLAGWQFSEGVNYIFPATNIAPGGFVVVAQNPGFLQTKYNVVGVLGPYTNNLSKYGETITLRNALGQVEDAVDYQLGFPWPIVGDPTSPSNPGSGDSLELIHPALDNDLAGSWRSSLSSGGGGSSQSLLTNQSTWKYFKGTVEASSPTSAWRQPAFDDATWLSGRLSIGYGESFVTTVLSDMSGGYTAVFLRKQFVVANPAEFTRLVLEAQYDDGFKVWINGTLVIDGEANVPAGELVFNATAISALENLNFVAFNLAGSPATLLVPGLNTIAVQAHNSSLSGSSDFFFDARVLGQSGGSSVGGPSPGRVNTVFATNAPPQIRQVDHSPSQPVNGQPVKITAKVTDPHGVASVTLQYQIVQPGNYIELTDPAFTNAANWISLPMNDAGASGDVTAGDDVFSAQIPGSVQVHRRLIRYRITIADTLGLAVRVPYADDPQPNFAYFVYDGVPTWTGATQPGAGGPNGVAFTVSTQEMSRLPVYHLITRSNSFATAVGWAPGTANNKYGGDDYLWTGALVVDGTVYDHIGFRCRGGVWRYSMGKNAMKFRLNRGHDLEVKDNWGRKLNAKWRRLSFRANIQQGDYNHRGEQGMFEAVGYRLFELAGVSSPKTVQLQFRVIDDARETVPGNQFQSDFYGLWLAVEEHDGRFLEERGLNDGNVYDMEGVTGTLNHIGPEGPLNKADLNALLSYGSPTPTEAWWRTNLNLRSYYGYQAIIQGIHHYDIADGKNYFYYRDPVSRLWEVFPWDLDLTWADNMYRSDATRGDEPFRSRVINNFTPPGTFPTISTEFRNRVREIRDLLFNNDEGFKLIDEYANLTRGPLGRPSIIDADRALWDFNPVMNDSAIINPSKAGQGRFYQWPNEPTVSKTFDGTVQLMKNYVINRSTTASLNGSSTGMDGIATDNAKPNRPTITYTGPQAYPINRVTLRSSAYSGSNPFASLRWRVGEITDTNSPSYDPTKPWKYEIEPVWESGPISPFQADITIPASALKVGSRYRVRVQHTDATGRNSQWSLPHAFTCGDSEIAADLLNDLRITEVMFNPPFGGYEYVELHNISSSVTLDLAGVRFTQGIDFTCLPATILPPGGYLLVVKAPTDNNFAAFRAFYGLDISVSIVGAFTGALDNAGEQITLRTSAGGTDIVAFTYGDGRGWPPAADGGGHSLVFSDSAEAGQGSGSGEFGGNWRPSRYRKGSPGRADGTATTTVVLNEITAHTDFLNEFDSNDWIELYNATDSPITLGPGWYLSDDAANLTKWQIPASTVIGARGWVSFDEQTGFHFPTNIGFGLSKDGEQVLLSHLPGTAQDRVVDAVSFKAQENDWSLGRYPDGAPLWYALNPRTRDVANAAPGLHVVINEVLFHPPDLNGTNDNSLDEFIELFNPTAAPVQLWNTNTTWRLDGGVNYDFPTNTTLAPGQFLLVVNFNPATNVAQLAAFRSLYGTDSGLAILGPYSGQLANNSDRIGLEQALAPQGGGSFSWIIVDEVIYADQAPWPCGADGSGNSLQRLSALQHGSDSANWSSEPPTAGQPRANLPAGLPSITTQPRDAIVATNANASFNVAVCGTPPFTYQWRFHANNLGGETNSTLNFVNVTTANAGNYSVLVANAAGSITSAVAVLIVQLPPTIINHPQPFTVIRDQAAMFSVTGGGTPPLSYQWRFAGANIPGGTSRELVLTNVQAFQAGNYSAQVYNAAGSVVSSNALLTVRIPATITNHPVSQTVTNGTNVTLSVGAYGTGTLVYQWMFNGVNLSGENSPTLLLANVQGEHAGTYRVSVTDNIGTALSQPAVLTVLVRPTIIMPPVNQSVLAGSTVTFSVQTAGSLPMGYRWRKSAQFKGFSELNSHVAFLVITNVQAADAASYTVVVSNEVNRTGVLSAPGAVLTVLADADGDGMDDAWEDLHAFDRNVATDAALDSDGDGVTNKQEYDAGTNPHDPGSYLKIDEVSAAFVAQGTMSLRFEAAAGRTYTVQSREVMVPSLWSRVADVVAASTNRMVEILDHPGAGVDGRYYRLVTPRVP